MEEMQEALRGKREFSKSSVLSVSACTFSNDSLDEHDGSSSQRDSSTIVSEFSSTKTLMNIDDSSTSVREFFLNQNETSKQVGKIFQVDYCLKDSWLQSTTIPRTETSSKKKLFSKSASHLNSTKSQSITTQETINSEPVLQKTEKNFGRKKPNQRVPLRDRNISTKEKTPQEHVRRNVKRKSSPKPKKIERNDRAKLSSSPSPTRTKRPRFTEIRKDQKDPKTRSSKTEKGKHPTLGKSETLQNQKKSSNIEKQKHQKGNKIVLDFGEFPPPRSERRIQLSNTSSSDEDIDYSEIHHSHQLNNFYLSPIEENSEASTSGGSTSQEKYFPRTKQTKKVAFADSKNHSKEFDFPLDFDTSRKYHTYPKSRIPIPRRSLQNREFRNLMDPKLYPLEPREIDLEAFQQLHTADSQEELQEFLLLESQCSGNLGLATNYSNSEISDHHSDDERGTMSGIFVFCVS